MGCSFSRGVKYVPGYEDPAILAKETFLNQVEALYELFVKLSCSIIKDGLIHKEEFQLALFRDSKNRICLLTGSLICLMSNTMVINFGEFVRSLSVFHPSAPVEEKIAFAFKLYDLRQTGYIEHEELKEMVLALLNESDLCLSDDLVETIVNQTFVQVDLNEDGKIDPDEWKEFATRNPSLIKNMTLSYLKDITTAFPSFVFSSETEDANVIG